jgi:hypothetical protein
MNATKLRPEAAPRASTPQTLPAIARVPEPVRRYLTFTHAHDRAPIRRARLAFRGWLKLDPKAKSYFIRSTLELQTEPWSRTWTGSLKFPLGWARGRDTYDHGHGQMKVDAFSAIPVARVTGPEMDVSELVTLLAELPFLPTSLIPSESLTWSPIDERSALATLRDGELEATGVFRFDERGRITRFESDDRYCRINGGWVRAPWYVKYREYVPFGRVQVPMWLQAGWLLQDGQFEYADFSVADVEFDAVQTHS